jgi:DNA helicase-2/ATP-dependent DNA helicase PcrA
VLDRLPDYEALLHQKGYLDYSGILKEAVEQLRNNVQLRTRLSEKIRHVIVDEYQDVNPIQEAVVRTLHDLGAGICVVGDDDQTIYQWRGSDVQNILNFSARSPAVQQVKLEENFRSSEGVVTVAREFIKQLVQTSWARQADIDYLKQLLQEVMMKEVEKTKRRKTTILCCLKSKRRSI